jgi:hypothetical protein
LAFENLNDGGATKVAPLSFLRMRSSCATGYTNTTLVSDFNAEAQGRGERRDKAYGKSFPTLCLSAALR